MQKNDINGNIAYTDKDYYTQTQKTLYKQLQHKDNNKEHKEKLMLNIKEDFHTLLMQKDILSKTSTKSTILTGFTTTDNDINIKNRKNSGTNKNYVNSNNVGSDGSISPSYIKSIHKNTDMQELTKETNKKSQLFGNNNQFFSSLNGSTAQTQTQAKIFNNNYVEKQYEIQSQHIYNNNSKQNIKYKSTPLSQIINKLKPNNNINENNHNKQHIDIKNSFNDNNNLDYTIESKTIKKPQDMPMSKEKNNYKEIFKRDMGFNGIKNTTPMNNTVYNKYSTHKDIEENQNQTKFYIKEPNEHPSWNKKSFADKKFSLQLDNREYFTSLHKDQDVERITPLGHTRSAQECLDNNYEGGMNLSLGKCSTNPNKQELSNKLTQEIHISKSKETNEFGNSLKKLNIKQEPNQNQRNSEPQLRNIEEIKKLVKLSKMPLFGGYKDHQNMSAYSPQILNNDANKPRFFKSNESPSKEKIDNHNGNLNANKSFHKKEALDDLEVFVIPQEDRAKLKSHLYKRLNNKDDNDNDNDIDNELDPIKSGISLKEDLNKVRKDSLDNWKNRKDALSSKEVWIDCIGKAKRSMNDIYSPLKKTLNMNDHHVNNNIQRDRENLFILSLDEKDSKYRSSSSNNFGYKNYNNSSLFDNTKKKGIKINEGDNVRYITNNTKNKKQQYMIKHDMNTKDNNKNVIKDIQNMIEYEINAKDNSKNVIKDVQNTIEYIRKVINDDKTYESCIDTKSKNRLNELFSEAGNILQNSLAHNTHIHNLNNKNHDDDDDNDIRKESNKNISAYLSPKDRSNDKKWNFKKSLEEKIKSRIDNNNISEENSPNKTNPLYKLNIYNSDNTIDYDKRDDHNYNMKKDKKLFIDPKTLQRIIDKTRKIFEIHRLKEHKWKSEKIILIKEIQYLKDHLTYINS